MMRHLFLIPLLALAACSGENSGWHPNYRMQETPYGSYLRAREAALTGFRAEPPQVIPVALPAHAPTPQEIAGPQPVRIAGQVPAVHPRTRVTVPSSPQAGGNPYGIAGGRTLTSGPYPGSVPVLVSYAATSRHAPGTAVWPRSGARAAADACKAWPTPAAAQTAFLAQGGPQRDPAGLDPDGDGYVCGWNPAPYRSAARP